LTDGDDVRKVCKFSEENIGKIREFHGQKPVATLVLDYKLKNTLR